MKRERTFKLWITGIGIVSLSATAIIVGSIALFPHEKVVLFSAFRQVMLLILGIVAAGLVFAETHRRNRIIFGLFVALGVQQILDLLYSFLPTAFPADRYIGHQYFQLVNGGLGLFIQSACLAGSVILMNTRIRTWLGLTLVAVIATIILAIELNPIIINPRHLYTTPDITDFRIIDRAWMNIYQEKKIHADAEAIANRVKLSKWEGRKRIGELTHVEAVRRIKEIEPYLFGSNYNMLIYKPMNNLWWQMNMFVGFVILLTIVYWFFGGSPSGVYFEKISVIVLCFSVFEAFHFHTYANLISYSDYLHYFNIGAFLSLLAVVVLIFVFFLRLHFLLSHEGRYYESRLELGGTQIARWRDGFDDYVVKKFFGENPFKSRFLTKIPRK
ncbi:MAG: hypothetical protein WEB33_01160 [Bacteroidota bacterium]